MTRFEVRDLSQDTITASPEAVWDVLTDPALLAEMTPLIEHITAVDADHWRWELASIGGLGTAVAPCFTVRMDFTEAQRIDFSHDPPAGSKERAGADGIYTLTPVVASGSGRDEPASTHLAVDMTVHVDLPLPAISRPAVTRVMQATMARMGERFAQNLCSHLGVPR